MDEKPATQGPPIAEVEAASSSPIPVSSMEAVLRSRLLTVGTTTLLAPVAALLSQAQSSLVVVCDAAGAVVGVITETVLIHQLGFGSADVFTTHAGEIMNRDFTACQASDSLPEVLAMMHARELAHVLVVEEGNKPVGVLTVRDGLRTLLAAGTYEEALLRDYVMGVGYR